jgi:uroporphyrinogen decarboxylase
MTQDPQHTAIPYLPEHVAMARELVREAHSHDGLAPIDLERFWADDEIARRDPFAADIPQVAFGATLTTECVYDELGVGMDFWRYDHDEPWRLELNKAYNDLAERIVGRKLLNGTPSDPRLQQPEHKNLHDAFEARNVWHEQSQSWWLEQSVNSEDELAALLDRVDALDIRSFILPETWAGEKERFLAAGGKLALYRGQRGPVTFCTSIFGVENLLLLLMTNPGLAGRLRDTVLRVILDIARVLDEEAGFTPETAPRGWGWADDNCCLLTPEIYEFFAAPILRGVFGRYAPDPGDWRHQHSDSAMGHLLPVLASLDFKMVNFGPTVTSAEIRRHMPRTVIQGQMAPFTYCRNEEENIVLEFLRDHAMTRETRGLLFATAGSVNNGSRLTGMRLAMAAIQRFGRY